MADPRRETLDETARAELVTSGEKDTAHPYGRAADVLAAYPPLAAAAAKTR